MQTATARRFAHAPLAAAIVVAAGLAGGVASLGMTDNLPWQSDSAAIVQQNTSGTGGNPLIKGGRGTGSGEGLIGPNAGFVSRAPVITGAPSLRQGEGLIGPGAAELPSSALPNVVDRADTLSERGQPLLQVGPGNDVVGFTESEGQTGPGSTSLPHSTDGSLPGPYDGGYTER